MATAIEALLEACERRSGEAGILTLRDQVNKNQALFYLNNGGVYAIEVDSYDPPIKTRLMRTGRISMESDLDSAISSVGGEKSLQLPALIVQRQIADEYDVALITKDFFLEVASEALSWESVKVSWRKGFLYNEYPIPPLEGGKLIEIVASRSVKFQQVAETFQVSSERVFEDVSVLVSPNFNGELSKPEESAIYLAVQGSHQKIGDLMVGLGLTRVSVMKYVYSLWHARAVDVYVNGVNIRGQEEETEEELTLDFMQSSAPSPDSAYESPAPAPVVVDEPIDSFSPSSAIPANPELSFGDAPAYSTADSMEETPYNITTLDSEVSAEEVTELEEEAPSDSSSRYSSNDEEEVVDLDFNYSPGTAQYAAPEDEITTLDFTQEDTPLAETDSPVSAPVSSNDSQSFDVVSIHDEATEEDTTGRSIQEETIEITQQADEKVEKMQDSVTEAKDAATSESGTGLLTEMQSMLAKINSAVGESTQTLAVLAQQIEETSVSLTNVRQERMDLESKIYELTQSLEQASEEENRLEEQAKVLDEKYLTEKDKVDEFTRGLDSLRSMFNS